MRACGKSLGLTIPIGCLMSSSSVSFLSNLSFWIVKPTCRLLIIWFGLSLKSLTISDIISYPIQASLQIADRGISRLSNLTHLAMHHNHYITDVDYLA